MGNLTALLSKIQPAMHDEQIETSQLNSGNAVFVEKVAAINVNQTVRAIIERSPILKTMIEAGEIGIVGGCHDISTGDVAFYEDTLIIN